MIEFKDVSVLSVGRDDVLVWVEGSGICGTDAKTLTKPVVMGHEVAGVVVRQCHSCKTGGTNLCKTPRQAGFRDVQGILSQYYVCDADFVVKFPDSLTWKEASFVFYSGCSSLGCLVMAVARAYGVSKILAFGRSQARGQDVIEWAESFKTTAMKEAGVESWGVDISIEVTSAEAYMHAGMTRPSWNRAINSFPTFTIVAKELDVIGTVRYTVGCFQTAIDLLASGKIDLKSMITAVFPLSNVVEALEYVMKGEGLKVILMNQKI
ncbi:GroES-like protein [Desarmillaria ectypa]|nr:GroES-like protein [Desarmillaria ectypa]